MNKDNYILEYFWHANCNTVVTLWQSLPKGSPDAIKSLIFLPNSLMSSPIKGYFFLSFFRFLPKFAS